MFDKRSCNSALLFVDNLFKIQCYYCKKYKHYKIDCFEIKQSTEIVTNKINKLLKNDQVSLTRRQRNKKNQ